MAHVEAVATRQGPRYSIWDGSSWRTGSDGKRLIFTDRAAAEAALGSAEPEPDPEPEPAPPAEVVPDTPVPDPRATASTPPPTPPQPTPAVARAASGRRPDPPPGLPVRSTVFDRPDLQPVLVLGWGWADVRLVVLGEGLNKLQIPWSEWSTASEGWSPRRFRGQ